MEIIWVVLLFWLSVFMVLYTYGGYYLLLEVFRVLRKGTTSQAPSFTGDDPPRVSVVVAAYNEEERIVDRIDNLLGCGYPENKVEILVVSDGSTDRTVDLVRSCGDDRVNLLEFGQNRGRAAVHNDAVRAATGQILVFTDAETQFEPLFLRNMIPYFGDESVGCVVGNLIYRTDDDAIAEAESLYWKYEKRLRNLESDLGLLATATGACMGVRKDLWKKLEATDDVDFIAPLDVIIQGYRVVFAEEAMASDFPPHSAKSELETRIRQTSRNFLGTIRKWTWRQWIKYPMVTWALISHKILRWLTPYFLLAVFFSNLFLYHEHTMYALTFACQIFFSILAVIGYLGARRKRIVPVASSIFAFCLANIGMAIGVFNALTGKIPAVYRKAD
jgi:cellulose synthase/poly-beta-1,6-N-acetylglucosamine synthase-like glycosyltransferase